MEVLADAQVAFGGLDRGECRKPLALAYREESPCAMSCRVGLPV